jgi:peptidoglycan/xylan/chitin deacetylase (PgdA/CDA1 family)
MTVVRRVRWVVLVLSMLALVAACASSADDGGGDGDARSGSAGLSFASGGDSGYTGTSLGGKQLALTFDDGPGSQTLALSSWLAGQGIRATFFVNGHCFGSSVTSNGQCQQNASATPASILGQVEADGHLVGNHTTDHYDLTTLSDSQIVSEVTTTDTIISPFVAGGHFVFRAPFGAWSAHDYTVLHASPMDKYVGPVSWDVGGAMTSRYAADWDCWQNLDGYGVMTTKACGDRYLNEIGDVGRGIVLMHDADYGNVTNHSLTSGQGNTIDMVKYIVPILKSQGYTFVRLDEVPDIASALGATPPPPPPTDAGTVTCAYDPTWQQTTYANNWWVEYAISGTVASASLEVVGGQTVTLSLSYGKWVGSPSSSIASGTQVIVHAKTSSGQTAQTKPFGYLVTTQPVTDCGSAPPPPVDAGTDAGTVTDAGSACTNAFSPTWSQGSGANNWWVEYAISGSVASAYLEVVGGQTVTLAYQYQKWVGPTSARIAAGASVIVHAQDTTGHTAQTQPFGYLNVTSPQTAPCPN